ncbi:2Fe-2S iron-sulfur cluster-binding protein [Sinomonas atrocyanea]
MPTNITAVDRDGTEHSLVWDEGQTLMETLRDNDLPVLASCGGTASCATCHVYLEEPVAARLGERSADEAELLADADGFRECGSRLSCQIGHDAGLDGIRVELAPES